LTERVAWIYAFTEGITALRGSLARQAGQGLVVAVRHLGGVQYQLAVLLLKAFHARTTPPWVAEALVPIPTVPAFCVGQRPRVLTGSTLRDGGIADRGRGVDAVEVSCATHHASPVQTDEAVITISCVSASAGARRRWGARPRRGRRR